MLIASQPTRGLDVGSIEFVHRRIVEQRDHGVAVVIVSSELDEIYALADRIAVMYEGKITGFRDPDVPAAELGRLMAGGADSGAAPRRPRRQRGRARPPGADDADAEPPATPARRRPRDRAPPPLRRTRDHRTARRRPPPPEERARRRRVSEPLRSATVFRRIFASIQETPSRSRCSRWWPPSCSAGCSPRSPTPTVLHAWSDFFSAPGNAIAQGLGRRGSATYVALFEGSVFNPHTVAALFQQSSMSTAIHDGYLSAVFDPLSETAVQATPLILTGLAVALPYQAGMFNIGGQSQFIGGAIMAAWLGYAVNLPFFVHVVVCVLGGFVGGAALGWLAGEIKARTGAHEVIVTIMLNYVMPYFLAYLLSSQSLLQAPGSSNPITRPIASNAHLPLLAGTHLRINAGFLIALACAFGGVVAAQPDHDRVRVPQRRRQRQRPSRVAGHERGAQLGAGDADRRRARRAGRRPRSSWAPTSRSTRRATAPTGSTRSPWRCSASAGRAAWWPRACCSARCTRDRPACRPPPARRCRSCRSSRR